MPPLESKVDRTSPEFAANAAAMRALVDELKARQAKTALGGGEAARAKHVVFLYMDGGPSQMDTFDPKPRLAAEKNIGADFEIVG